MKNILFYVSFNGRSRDTETLMIAFKQQGHRVFLLNQLEGLDIHKHLSDKGIKIFKYIPRFKNLRLKQIANIIYLIHFCWKNNIHSVFSHLEPPNFVAVFAQFCIRGKVYICRHHSDLYAHLKKDSDLSYKLIYKLAKSIIVVSANTKRYMADKEHVPLEKIKVINLAYDFSLYQNPDHSFINNLKNSSKNSLTLITIGQLVPVKRPQLSIQLIKLLIENNIDASLYIVGQGELLNECKALTDKLGLIDRVIFTGFIPNVLDYLSAADIVIHPSISEASCVVIKEAGLVEKPVLVCRGVGDFDDYIIHEKNGFVASSDSQQFLDDAFEIIVKNYSNKEKLLSIGINLKISVLGLFSVDNVISEYNFITNSLPNDLNR